MLNGINIDPDKISNGVWVDIVGSSFLIACVENAQFKNSVFRHGVSEISDAEYCKILADTILLDWRNVKDPDGNDLTYTKELAVIALTTNNDVRVLVDSVSTNLSYFGGD